MGVDRRTLSIAAGVVVVALLGWNLLGSTPAATPVTAPTVLTTPERGGAVAGLTPEQMEVRLEALTRMKPEPGEAARNPFRFQLQAAPALVDRAPSPASAEAAPLVPSGPAPLPPIPLKFIGLLERADGAKWAVLADSRGPLHGREGDTIDGRYLIVKIGTESIEMAYADGRGKQTIRLTGQ